MHEFQHFFKSSLAICALTSEYLLLFDGWVITSPGSPLKLGSAFASPRIPRKAWLAALKTAIAYAVLEPLCCWLIAAVNVPVSYWMYGAALAHIQMVTLSCHIKLAALQRVAQEHKEHCVPVSAVPEGKTDLIEDLQSDAINETYRDQPSGESNEKGDLMEKGEPMTATKAVDGTEKPAPCSKHHRPQSSFYLANYIPILTAAMVNASFLLYVRYLTTDDSSGWLNKFAFGWTVIALMFLFLFGVQKHQNLTMNMACGRPVFPARNSWDVGQRLSCLLTLLVVRTLLRNALSQTAFTSIEWSARQSALILQGSPTGDMFARSYHSASDSDEAGYNFKSWALSIGSLVINGAWISHRVYEFIRKRRERRQGNMG